MFCFVTVEAQKHSTKPPTEQAGPAAPSNFIQDLHISEIVVRQTSADLKCHNLPKYPRDSSWADSDALSVFVCAWTCENQPTSLSNKKSTTLCGHSICVWLLIKLIFVWFWQLQNNEHCIYSIATTASSFLGSRWPVWF